MKQENRAFLVSLGMMVVFVLLGVLIARSAVYDLSTRSFTSGKLHERDYQQYWCTKMNGQQEVQIGDSARVDCLTDKYVVEIEFAPKWEQSVGQSLYYSMLTGKKAGVVLIEQSGNTRYRERLLAVIKQYQLPITVWYIGQRPDGNSK